MIDSGDLPALFWINMHSVPLRRLPEFTVEGRQSDRFYQHFLPRSCSGKMHCVIRLKMIPTCQRDGAFHYFC